MVSGVRRGRLSYTDQYQAAGCVFKESTVVVLNVAACNIKAVLLEGRLEA